MTPGGGWEPVFDVGWRPIDGLDEHVREHNDFDTLCASMGCGTCTASVYDTPWWGEPERPGGGECGDWDIPF